MKALFLALALFGQAAWAQPKPDEVVATVGSTKITRKQLEEYHQQNLRFVTQRKITREVSLDDLINRALGIQRARKTGLDKDPMVVSKMEDILFHAQVSKDLEGPLSKITVSDDEVAKYYADNKEYRTAHILFRLPIQPTPDEVDKAAKAADKAYQEVSANPDTFTAVATKASQGTTAPAGGDLGYQPPVRLAPEYYAAIKGQKVGFISRPVRTQMGYHVVRVLGVKDFDQIDKNLYKKIIYDQKRDALMNAYFQGLKKGADVKILAKP